MIGAFIAALTGATSIIIDKTIMSRERVNFITYLAASEIFLFFTAILFYPKFGLIKLSGFEWQYIISFASIIGIAYLYNFLYYYSLNHEKVCDVEPLVMLHPLIATLLAATFYETERSLYILIFTLIAAVALVLSRIERHHLNLNTYSVSMLFFVFLLSVEGLFVKKLLEVFSPIALYGLRTGVLAILFILFLKPQFKSLNPKKYFHIFIAATVIVGHYILMYYSIYNLGLVMTNLIFLLIPVMVIFGSKFVLKEKIEKKRIFASLVILICITGALLVGR